MNDHPRTCPNCGDDWSTKHPDAPSFSCPACPWPWVNDPDTGFYRPNADPVRIVAKALTTVHDLVYCEGLEDVVRTYHTTGGVESFTAALKRPCKATHRTLLLGPEVEA